MSTPLKYLPPGCSWNVYATFVSDREKRKALFVREIRIVILGCVFAVASVMTGDKGLTARVMPGSNGELGAPTSASPSAVAPKETPELSLPAKTQYCNRPDISQDVQVR